MSVGVFYNRELKIAAVGPSAWAKLGPERWFKEYTIVCANSRGYNVPYIIDLGYGRNGAVDFTTENTIATPAFQALAQGKLRDFRFLAYKPLAGLPAAERDRFIVNPISFGRFENKRLFRELFFGKVPIAAYELVPFTELFAGDAATTYEQVSKTLGPNLVLQDELSSGGRGTYFVHSADDMRQALNTLRAHHRGSVCVASRLIDGVERSIQGCLTADRLLTGPLQQQLVRNTELVSTESRKGMHFCGARFIYDEPAPVREQITKITATIAEVLRTSGYKGIFGVDFLVDSHNQVYVLEINARTTGVLPLLNEQASDVPLYLVHILEIMGEEYHLEEIDAPPADKAEGPASFVVLFNQDDTSAFFGPDITTGNYRLAGNGLQKINDEPRWHPDADMMLQLFCSSDLPAESGLKLCNIFLKEDGFNDGGLLNRATRDLLALLREHIIRKKPGAPTVS